MDVKRILFPVDLTDFSERIVPEAISVAEKFGAEVHLLAVVEPLEQFSTFYVPHPSLDLFEKEMVERAERKLLEFEDLSFVSYRNVKHAVLRGRPADEILKYIGSEKIDMVIMATHRRKGLERALLGSVADEVIRRSPVPVMTLNPSEHELAWRVSNIRPEDELQLRPTRHLRPV